MESLQSTGKPDDNRAISAILNHYNRGDFLYSRAYKMALVPLFIPWLSRVNTSYLVLQAMVMWGNGWRMEFVRDAKILRRNFVIDLLSYKNNSCRYTIPANIQQRLINISTKE
ncbi:hypothetical protein ZEAMMB73_Zm00001d023561 [Zea mays]|uniref:Uncharacterized protein n=1 Tax=Zea mays TaxID=4577 RepID=A0A1D6IU47_MAIZE|nr:hypothetical protein ZEAMMB73_Zm00001d023561 [Zea mays]